MKQHVTVVGALYIAFGIVGILIATTVLAGTIGSGLIALFVEGDALPLGILSIVGSSVALFLVVLFVPGIVGGIGLLKRKQWARYLVLILAILNLFNIPIGTALGIYTFWVLLQDETAKLFA